MLKDLTTPPKQIEDVASDDPSPANVSSKDTLLDPEYHAEIGLLYYNVALGCGLPR